jgi:hypothetical protein
MKLTRTRLILVSTVGALIAVAAFSVVLGGHGGGGSAAPNTGAQLSRLEFSAALPANTGPGSVAAGSAAQGDVAALSGSGSAAAGGPSYGDANSVAKAFSVDASTAGSGSVAGAEAAAPAAPSTDQGAQPAQLPDVLGRKIVQTTDIDVQVKEVPRSFQDIVRIATTAGGFVASSTFSNADKQQIADLTIRVPADQYQSVLAQVRGMGDVATEKSDANDATQEYTDLQARMRTLQATEQRYLDLLARAETVPDILTLQDRLDSVRGQIEQVQGRINLLDHLTDLATITVHLRPLAVVAQASTGGGAHPINAAQSAWEHSLEALRNLAAAALVVTVFSWWLIPPLAALAFGARWWLGRRPRPSVQTT